VASGKPVRMVWEASEPGESRKTSFDAAEVPPNDERFCAFVDTAIDGYFLLPSLLDPNSMMMSGLATFCPSWVEGRPLEEVGRTCCTTYDPVPVGVDGWMGEGVSLRVAMLFLGWYSVVLFCTLEQSRPLRDLSQGKASSNLERCPSARM
jgi:hypothetical protein